MRPADSALGIFRSPDPDLCVPGRRILRPREPCNMQVNLHVNCTLVTNVTYTHPRRVDIQSR